jgi:branched-chain amino acid aminotransferase
MGSMVYLNGKFVPEAEAVVSVIDHGLMYGDGIFEGIRVYNRKVFKLREHVARLYAGAKALTIEIPMAQEQFVDAVLSVVRINEVVDGYVRVTVSRGPALGLDPRNCTKPTIIIMTGMLALYPEEMYRNGLNVVTVSTRVAPAQVLEPRIKSLGKYVANIQAKIEANMVNAGEGLMLNIEGYVAECTGDNIFIIKNGRILTPPGYAGILEGITRATVMDIAREAGVEVIETMMTLFDVYTADECFLTGTAAEVIPVVNVDGRMIGDGKPGDLTNRLIKAFRAFTASEGVPV